MSAMIVSLLGHSPDARILRSGGAASRAPTPLSLDPARMRRLTLPEAGGTKGPRWGLGPLASAQGCYPGPGSSHMRPDIALRELLAGGDTVVAPGVYDGLSARLAARAGFSAVYATGGGIARSLGYPDLGLLGMSEVIERLVPIVESAAVPVIADADTGYGNALSVHRTVRAFERAGVAALHLEDQTSPKRCGHLDDKAVVPAAEMVQKLRAARDATADGDLVLIGRTDARAVEG